MVGGVINGSMDVTGPMVGWGDQWFYVCDRLIVTGHGRWGDQWFYGCDRPMVGGAINA